MDCPICSSQRRLAGTTAVWPPHWFCIWKKKNHNWSLQRWRDRVIYPVVTETELTLTTVCAVLALALCWPLSILRFLLAMNLTPGHSRPFQTYSHCQAKAPLPFSFYFPSPSPPRPHTVLSFETVKSQVSWVILNSWSSPSPHLPSAEIIGL